MNYISQTEITGFEIRRTREQLGLTQKEFSKLLNVSKSTVEKWEGGKAPINGLICFAIKMIERNMDVVNDFKIPEKVYPIRLYYMLRNDICTVIDVDERLKQVQIFNYKIDDIETAFGKNANPSYDDYLEFLESRCFPKERDNIKLILKDLNIPFYDPIMIIEKTEGRMAEDDFWIKMER